MLPIRDFDEFGQTGDPTGSIEAIPAQGYFFPGHTLRTPAPPGKTPSVGKGKRKGHHPESFDIRTWSPPGLHFERPEHVPLTTKTIQGSQHERNP